ncbi:MAG: hypothetical protein ACERKZ_16410 [Lachnotalea sp.]
MRKIWIDSVLRTINTFLPCGMFVLALPDVFNKPWFYITGVVFTAISASNIIMMLKYPKKKPKVSRQRILMPLVLYKVKYDIYIR